MDFRRILFLALVVLTAAALANLIARPGERDRDRAATTSTTPEPQSTTPAASPGNSDKRTTTPSVPLVRKIEFPAGAEVKTGTAEVGEPVTVLVDVRTPGRVDIPSLGLTAPADPLTPARFDIFESRTGRHKIEFDPPGPDTLPSVVGELRITEPKK